MRFQSKPIPEHAEVPRGDGGRWEQIIAEWDPVHALQKGTGEERPAKGNACFVLSVAESPDPRVGQARLDEIVNLVEAQGDTVVEKMSYYLAKPNPRTLLGSGKAREIAALARQANANLLVIDAELSPTQARNLEDEAGIPISDREMIILNVFLRNAKTIRARMQVEIARLEYLRPRIRGIGLNMDQQAGGMPGARGAGETASELLARKLDGRLNQLRKQAAKMKEGGRQQRSGRKDCQRIVLVGYTNAGKTTLMNALTAETLSARAMPFETLDTTTRNLSRHGADVLLSDTVGFIRRLPERLLASFESTLEEINDASLILIVVDVSDYEWQAHLKITEELLGKLEADAVPRFYLFNKLDRTDAPVVRDLFADLAKGFPWFSLSGKDRAAVGELKTKLLATVRRGQTTKTIFVPYAAASALNEIYARCRVVQSREDTDGIRFKIEAPAKVVERIESLVQDSAENLAGRGNQEATE